jgi:predicted ribosome quality control (RQC) complex YloA/Tae2 family protein
LDKSEKIGGFQRQVKVAPKSASQDVPYGRSTVSVKTKDWEEFSEEEYKTYSASLFASMDIYETKRIEPLVSKMVAHKIDQRLKPGDVFPELGKIAENLRAEIVKAYTHLLSPMHDDVHVVLTHGNREAINAIMRSDYNGAAAILKGLLPEDIDLLANEYYVELEKQIEQESEKMKNLPKGTEEEKKKLEEKIKSLKRDKKTDAANLYLLGVCAEARTVNDAEYLGIYNRYFLKALSLDPINGDIIDGIGRLEKKSMKIRSSILM